MNGTQVWEQISFVIVHMFQYELLVFLLFTALASRYLATVLDKLNTKRREAALARKIAVAYASLTLILWLAGRVLR